MNRGYLFLCFGKYYVDEASNLVKMLRKVGDEYPVSILCAKKDFDYATSLELFNNIIIFNFDNEFSKLDNTPFETFGGTPKILMVDYLPYEETIYLDTDMLVQSSPNNVWDIMASYNQPCVLTGTNISGQDIGYYKLLADKLSMDVTKFNHVHSGIVYFNKTNKEFELFSNTLKYFWKHYTTYGLLSRKFREGKADEPVFSASINKLNYKVIDATKIPIITHNYHFNIELPSNINTGGSMHNIHAVLDAPIPFIHMFKQYRVHYDTLYSRLITHNKE